MNKTKLFLLSLLLPFTCFSLTSCEKEIEPKINLVYGQLWDENKGDNNFAANKIGTNVTTYNDLQTMINNSDTFMGVVRGSYPCGCWDTFKTSCLMPLIKNYNLKCYLIDNSVFKNGEKDDFGINYSSIDHNVFFVKNGEVIAQKYAIYGEDFSSKYSTFKKWADDIINTKPKMLYVSKAQLDNLYKGKKNTNPNDLINDFTIYFSRSTCGDCSYFNSYFLTEYLASSNTIPNSSCYIIDCDQVGIRLNNDLVYDENQWLSFKAEYGLSWSNDNPAGYNTGYVPTLYHILCTDSGTKTGDVIDGADVFFNDSFEKLNDETFKITESYFTQERSNHLELSYLSTPVILKGLTYGVNSSSQNDYIYYQYSLFNYHVNIATQFFQRFVGQQLNY